MSDKTKRQAENEESYAAGVKFGQESNVVERIVYAVLENTIGIFNTDRGLERDDIFNKGVKFGVENKKTKN